jgi:hypothetical protein
MLVAGGAVAALVLTREEAAPPGASADLPAPGSGLPTPVPGQPPVVWLSARLSSVSPARVVVVEPEGARITLRRLGPAATRFYLRDGRRWIEAPQDEIETVRAGTPVCAEALLDGGHYVALRLFLGSACGPRD